MQNQTVDEGDTAFFTCQATGTPILNISWYFNGVLVENTNTMEHMISEMSLNSKAKSGTLAVKNVVSSDIGTYTCNAYNHASSDSNSGVLTVHGKDVNTFNLCALCRWQLLCRSFNWLLFQNKLTFMWLLYYIE